jgi:hypothetical protein
VLRKLATYLEGGSAQSGTRLWQRQSAVDRFLAGRCDRVFLEAYLSQSPKTLERVSTPGLFLQGVPEVDLALKLSDISLLPEVYRSKFVENVIQYTVDGEDGYVFQSKRLRAMLTSSENEDLLRRLRSELVPNLGRARRHWESNYHSDEDPESYMQPFEEVLAALESEFAEDEEVLETVSLEATLTREWVTETTSDLAERQEGRELRDEEGDEDDCYDGQAEFSHSPEQPQERSIFDDVDG